MIIWQGWGILTVAIIGGIVMLGTVLLQAMGLRPPATGLQWTVILPLLAAAAANWWIGLRMNSTPGRELVDPRTGERLILRRRHSLFWIPMQYWSVAPLLLAVVLVGVWAAGLAGLTTPRVPGGKPPALQSGAPV